LKQVWFGVEGLLIDKFGKYNPGQNAASVPPACQLVSIGSLVHWFIGSFVQLSMQTYK
jgi:hypothetical protein